MAALSALFYAVDGLGRQGRGEESPSGGSSGQEPVSCPVEEELNLPFIWLSLLPWWSVELQEEP